MRAVSAQVAAFMARAGNVPVVTPMPGMVLLRHTAPTDLSPTLYEPVVCLVLQGRKETTLGETTLDLGPGQSLLVSHDVPVVARITEARRDAPYLAIVLRIDIALVRSLYDKISEALADREPPRSVAVHETDPRLLDCVSRYLLLADDPVEAKVMAPLVLEEIHFRLLMAPHGGMLRELLRHDSHASHIARAIARIRREFRTALAVRELARDAAMSESAFYKYFREITSSTRCGTRRTSGCSRRVASCGPATIRSRPWPTRSGTRAPASSAASTRASSASRRAPISAPRANRLRHQGADPLRVALLFPINNGPAIFVREP
jgi:hypothetical protein